VDLNHRPLGYEANPKTTALYFNDLTAPGTTESH